LTQALAALSEEAGKALGEIDLKTKKSSADFQRQPDNATKSLKARNRAGEPGRGPPESGREPSQLGPLLPGAGDRAVYREARQRILALAQAADHRDPAQSQDGGRAPQTPVIEALKPSKGK
jgi:hypothetical protein